MTARSDFAVRFEAAGERENFERGELGAVVGNRVAAGLADGAEDVDDACVRDGDDVAGLNDDVVRHVAGFENLAEIDGDGVGERRGNLRRVAALSRRRPRLKPAGAPGLAAIVGLGSIASL